jgi:hypothetical protein
MKLNVSMWALAVTAMPGVWGFTAWDQAARPAQPAQPAATAGEAGSERVVVPWSDPSRPGTLRVSLLNGHIVVRGYDGKDVIVEARTEDDDDKDKERSSRRRRGSEDPDAGLRRITNVASGLTVEEENNEMRIGASMPQDEMRLTIQVPRRTSLNLSGVNDGSIVVENVDGEIEASHVNGPVTLTNVGGSVVAHALNDDLIVKMSRVSGKPMSFSSMNGDIDVTLPVDLKANVRLETVSGEILTDFDLTLLPNQVKKTVEERKAAGGRYRVKLERSMMGTINGGGPELSFKNFNGDIRIRKAK